MKNILLVFFLLSAASQHLYAQLTAVQSLSLEQRQVEVPEKFKAVFTGNFTVNVPPGYKARIFYAGGLGKPRSLSFDHKGVLHVSDQTNGKVYAMSDANQDGIADTLIVAAEGFSGNHDVKFYKRFMYVTEEKKVWKLTDADSNGIYELRDVLIDNLAQGAPTGGHRTRSIAIDSINQKIYVSIGSACNACREEQRAAIEQYDIDGTNRRIFANGARNSVGLTLHPSTNKLWANNNGSDNLGNAIPPEWIDIVRDGGFYGYPFAYGNKTWVNFNAASDYQALLPITSSDSAKVNKMILPAAQIEAHSAPMGITFLNASFPDNLKSGMITALRGSWNAPGDHRGYKLIYVDFTDWQDTTANFVADFCTGFITDTVARTYWARPVGVAINNNGEVFMSSDETTKFIMHIYREKSVGLNEQLNDNRITLYPNPSSGLVYIEVGTDEKAIVRLYDGKGVEIKVSSKTENGKISMDVSRLTPGTYNCVITGPKGSTSRKILIQK